MIGAEKVRQERAKEAQEVPAVVREGALHQLGGSLVRCLMMITLLLVVIMTNAARIMVSCAPSKSVHNKHGRPPRGAHFQPLFA